jgi:hypothetical protein
MKSSLSLDIYEIRSFKMRYALQSYTEILKKPDNTTAFFVTDSLYRDERGVLIEQFLKNKINVKITMVPKKISRVLFRMFKKEAMLNLLKGQTYLLETTKKDFFSKEVLNLLLYSNKIYLRAIISQNKIYRKSCFVETFEKYIQKNQSIFFDCRNLNLSKIHLTKIDKQVLI